MPASLRAFARRLCRVIRDAPEETFDLADELCRVQVYTDRLHHEMVQRAAAQVQALVDGGTPPTEIAVISPFLSDSLFHGLARRLRAAGVPFQTHRPSRTLRDEPVTKVLLTLAALAHPAWGMERPAREAVAHMFNRLIESADLVRAVLLAAAVYEETRGALGLRPFDNVASEARERITYRVGEAYETLRGWLRSYQEGDALPIDLFFSRAFGELLSRPGFGFCGDVPAGMHVAGLVESAQKFRRAVGDAVPGQAEGEGVQEAYVEMVQEGVVSAFYAMDWSGPSPAVLIAPAHTFLLRNRTCEHQLWLDVGSPSWHRRIHQPLTNPYVLSRDWKLGDSWSSAWEARFETERLTCMVAGLVRRCTGSVHLFASELSAHGQEQAGDLLVALGHVMRDLAMTPSVGPGDGP